jgi:formylglycine-generating enzyme required for sulfatase activity
MKKDSKQLSTILFTDIQGFSTLLREEEEKVLNFLEEVYYPLGDRGLSNYAGRLIRREGDAIVAEFLLPEEALAFAEFLQQSFWERSSELPKTFALRIGIHLGEVSYKQGEVLGHTLSVAKRLESFCRPGGVCFSQEVWNHLSSKKSRFHFQDLGFCPLKGIGKIHVYQGYLPQTPLSGFAEILIPFLAHQIKEQELVVLCGPEWNSATQENTLKRSLEPHASDLAEAAQIYQEEHSRLALTQLLQTLLQASENRLSPEELLFLQFSFPLILTTTLAGSLDQALRQKNLWNKTHLWGSTPAYYPLYGGLEQGDFVLTEDDIARAFHQWEELPSELLGILATKTLLFVGFSPDSRLFKNFYRRLSELVFFEETQRRFLLSEESVHSLKWWSTKGVEVLQTPLVSFFEGLLEQQKKEEQDLAPERLPAFSQTRPYKFLDYFEKEDQALFFGRESDIPLVLSKIYAQPLFLLYAKSGVGKTSLIHAGLRPRLEQEGYLTCYLRVFDDPLQSIKQSVNLQLDLPLRDSEELVLWAFLRNAVRQAQRPLILFLDQFEEFFIRLGKGTQNHFIHELESCLKKTETQTRFIFSLREDFLAELESFKERIPSIFHQGYRLQGLQREEAKKAILGPASLFQLEWEESLVEVLLRDLDEGCIEPPHLQILCDRLYEKRVQGKILLQQYQEMGGAPKVLAEYMTSVLALMPPLQRDQAEKILKTLVTSLETKALLPVQELLAQVNFKATGESKEILQHLIDQRLIRSFEQNHLAYCELAHDYLALQIRGWLDEEEFKAKEIQHILRQEENNWKHFQWLIEVPKLEVFYQHRKNPHLRFSSLEVELLVRSSLKHQRFFEYWWVYALEQQEMDWLQLPRLLDTLDSPSGVYALEVVSTLKDPPALAFIVQHLFHEKVRLREKALEILTQLQIQDLWTSILPLLEDPYPSVRWRVVEYLKTLSHPQALQALKAYQPEGMIFIPEGTFERGSEINPEEGPIRKLFLKAFYIDKYPVRNQDYALFLKATGHPAPKQWQKGEYPQGEANHPVVHVSWHDAHAYAEWAGKRLPQESEWEKAARGREGRKYPWGEESDIHKANTLESNKGYTVAVGSYSPEGDSPYGLVDVAGQVWEWTENWFQAYEGSTYESPYYGKQVKVVRGGSWSSQISLCRTSYRGMGHPDYPFAHGGFRCVMDPPFSPDSKV